MSSKNRNSPSPPSRSRSKKTISARPGSRPQSRASSSSPSRSKLLTPQETTVKQKIGDLFPLTLHFMLSGKPPIDVSFEDKPLKSYMDLQTEICKQFPTSKSLFVIQNEYGEVVRPQNFKATNFYNVREIPSVRMEKMKFHPKVSSYWEFKEYHGAPKGWRNIREEKRLAKKREMQLQADIDDEEERKIAELEGRHHENDDDMWDTVLKK